MSQMFNCLITLFAILSVMGLGVFLWGIHNAQEIDPKKPFLHDDYKESSIK